MRSAFAGILFALGAALAAGCIGTPDRPVTIVAEYTAGILAPQVSSVVVIPFDVTAAAAHRGGGRALAEEYTELIRGMGYTMRGVDTVNTGSRNAEVLLTAELKTTICAAAAAAGIQGVVVGRMMEKTDGTPIHALTLLETATGTVVWTVRGENATPQAIIAHLRKKMGQSAPRRLDAPPVPE